MTDEGGKADGGDGQVAVEQGAGQQHRQQALEQVAEQGQRGGLLAGNAQHIGGAGIARTLAARILETHQPAQGDGR